jgi:hypothetical protein
MPTTYNWYAHCQQLADNNPDTLIFAVCNRMGHEVQMLKDAPTGDDIAEHRKYGHQREWDYWGKVYDGTNGATFGGLLMLCSKATWKAAGGFAEGLISVDSQFHKAVRNSGRSVLLGLGLYVYHWYRGGISETPKHLLKGPVWLLDGNETYTTFDKSHKVRHT